MKRREKPRCDTLNCRRLAVYKIHVLPRGDYPPDARYRLVWGPAVIVRNCCEQHITPSLKPHPIFLEHHKEKVASAWDRYNAKQLRRKIQSGEYLRCFDCGEAFPKERLVSAGFGNFCSNRRQCQRRFRMNKRPTAATVRAEWGKRKRRGMPCSKARGGHSCARPAGHRGRHYFGKIPS